MTRQTIKIYTTDGYYYLSENLSDATVKTYLSKLIEGEMGIIRLDKAIRCKKDNDMYPNTCSTYYVNIQNIVSIEIVNTYDTF